MVLLALSSCDRSGTESISSYSSPSPPPVQTSYFQDVTEAEGLPIQFDRWGDGTFAMPETTAGSGVALFDFDGDGRLDIYQVIAPPPGDMHVPAKNRLYWQQPDGTFKLVNNAAGLDDPGFGQGVAIGDYNNDGLPDVYVTNYGHNTLYQNGGNGRFEDVTAKAGVLTKDDLWSSSAAFVDYDRDGLLDLFVCHFVQFDPARVCVGENGKPEYCRPAEFKGVRPALYHNNGDGTFTDVAERAGVTYPSRAWGVTCADFTGDGWVDIFVANDEEQQNLYVNQHDGTFKDEAILRGVAFNGIGRAEAGMGVAVGDLRNDGQLALFITHFTGEKNTLYSLSQMPGVYRDASASTGMAGIDLPYTGWGAGFFDFDLDGNLDVAVVNGKVSRGKPHPKADLGGFWNAYAETNLLFKGDGKGKFADVSADAPDFTTRPENTRGLAFGDIDGYGRIDMVSNTIDGRLRIYHNAAPVDGNHWLMVRALTGKPGAQRDALGAVIRIRAGSVTRTRLIQSAYSFCSSSDPRAHFGLGKSSTVEAVDITWPDGTGETFSVKAVDAQVTFVQGEGSPGTATAPSSSPPK